MAAVDRIDIVRELLGDASLSAPDRDGVRSFQIPANGIPVKPTDFIVQAFGLDAAIIKEILPEGFSSSTASITLCRLVDPNKILLRLIWTIPEFDPAKLALLLPAGGGGNQLRIDLSLELVGAGQASTLSADLVVDSDLIISTEVDFSDHSLGLSALWQRQGPRVSTVLKMFGLSLGEFEGVTLQRIGFNASLPARNFTIIFGVNDLFRLDEQNFVISNSELTVFYFGGDHSAFLGQGTATALFGPEPQSDATDDRIKLDVSARYDGADFGWTFNGTVKNVPQDDPVGRILKAFVPNAESPFKGSDIKIESISVEFSTKSKNFKFDFDSELKLDAQAVRMIVSAHLTRQTDGKYEKFFSGRLLLGSELDQIEFDLIFDQAEGVNTFIAVYKNTDGKAISVRTLLEHVKPADLSILDQQLSLNIKDALFAYQKGNDGKSKYLFAIDTDFSINLSGLANVPLVGKALPAAQALDVAFEGLFSSTDKIEVKEGSPFRKLLPAGSPFIPEKLDSNPALLTTVHLGDVTVQVPLGVTELPTPPAGGGPVATNSGPQSTTTVPDTVPAPVSNVNWVDVQKHFGPLSVQKVGLSFDSATKTIGIFLEAELSVSGLTLSVEGLGAVYDLKTKDLTFALSGLGLNFKSGDLEIAGGFLNLDGDFAGKLTIKTKTFSISGLGAVAIVGGEPSIFIYGLLNYPIGGPAFFYVEGLAAGFGYNRSFKMPAIEGVRAFPLVVDAVDTAKAAGNVNADKNQAAANGATPVAADKAAIAAQLARLHEFIAPSLGEYFFAFGIKFSSFKLVNSFVLIALVAGKKLELDLIGVSTYQNPPVLVPNVPALARIELNIIGRLAPEEGFVGIQGQLTDNSYVYSNICKISGGFAFFSWFDGPHKGDFVLSVGGYHPSFVKPPHYPDVPRIALTYQITEKIYIKGSAYFALTPSTLMAGAAVEAHAEIGSVEAWFSASIDFIISWEPYHYDARLHVTIGAKWWIFQTEASADVEIWGPPFTGRANVTWTIFSFTVEFGDSAIRGPLPITFTNFESKFIPEKTKVCSVRVVRGVRNTIINGDQEIFVIDTADFVLEVRSTLPTLTGLSVESGESPDKVSGQALPTSANTTPFGIAPMDLAEVRKSELQITIKRDKEILQNLKASPLNFVPIEQNFPTGMWGKTLRVAATEGVIPALAGYTISPQPPTRSQSKGIPRTRFAFADPALNVFRPAEQGSRWSYITAANVNLQDVLRANVTTQKRTDLLKSLGIDASGVVRISESLPDFFLKGTQSPRVAAVQQS